MTSSAEQFRVMYRSFNRHVRAYCWRRTPPDHADDAAAEVFLIAWRKMDEAPNGDDALLWLYGIAYGVVSNQRRGHIRRQNLRTKLNAIGIDYEPLPEDFVVRREESRLVLDALGRLRPPEQELLRLSIWEGLDNEGLAKSLGISVDAAKKRLSRARRRLASQYERGSAARSSLIAQQGGTQ